MNVAEGMSIIVQTDGTVRINEDLRKVDRLSRQFLYKSRQYYQLFEREWKKEFLNGRLPIHQCVPYFNSTERSVLDQIQSSQEEEQNNDDVWFHQSSSESDDNSQPENMK